MLAGRQNFEPHCGTIRADLSSIEGQRSIDEIEGEAIAKQIGELMRNGHIQHFGEISVIARARWRSKLITQIFDKNKINWFDRSQISFDDSWEALLAISILELSVNTDSSDCLYNVMSLIESSWVALQHSTDDALDVAIRIQTDLKTNLNCSIAPENARDILSAANLWKLVKLASWSEAETKNRMANLERLIRDITDLATQTKLNIKDTISRLAGIGAVQILTGQESKGREFNHVFFIGIEEGLLPDRRANNDEQIAEERRIFYVGLTRAKKTAYLSSVSQRITHWGTIQTVKPSRFLSSIPVDLLSDFP